MKKEVCIIGLGPAGFGALNVLAKSSLASDTICVEVGGSLTERKCQLSRGKSCSNEKPCELISGVGGRSYTTGAKLSGYPAGGGLAQIIGSAKRTKAAIDETLSTLSHLLPIEEEKKVLSPETSLCFKKMGFEYRHYPVYTFKQSDLGLAYSKILSDASLAGVDILLKTKVIDIIKSGENFKLSLLQKSNLIEVEAKYVILCVGSEGQELVECLYSKFDLPTKKYHLDAGVRVEFPSELYHDIDKHHGDLKLLFKNARTFCICKEGKITPYRYHKIYALEGSLQKEQKTGFTNLAITIRKSPSGKNLSLFNEILDKMYKESGGYPVHQPLTQYLHKTEPERDNHLKLSSTLNIWRYGKIDNCFPQIVSDELKDAVQFFVTKLLPNEQWNHVNVFAPELDFRLIFPLQQDFSVTPKLYMAGECTGRFRGILQAFCSGEISANSILTDHNGGYQC
ncbi:MAG: hypothetical protein LBI79_02265 [Nitrososphaerota archaeon]|jgi:uncharacterized FAD-dependent dehydrogenase|nr:hypothetical protein [Nitrososphaerota archaeon]